MRISFSRSRPLFISAALSISLSSLAIITKPLTITRRPLLSRAPAGTKHALRCRASPLSGIFINPNLSHSTVKTRMQTTWSFLRSHSLALQSQKNRKPNRCHRQPIPAATHTLALSFTATTLHPFLLGIRVRHMPYFAYVSSNASSDVCLDMTHWRPPALRLNCSQSVQ